MCRVLSIGRSNLALPIGASLRAHGHDVVELVGADTRAQDASERSADVVLLHVGRDWQHARELCSELRAREADLPIVSAAEQYEARVELALLDAGADDHWAPPYAIDSLVTRVELRSRARARSSTRYRVGAIELDERHQDAFVDRHACGLTRREFGLLALLARKPMVVVTRAEVLRQWGFVHHGGSNLVDVHVARLRSKLGAGASQIETVRGRGFRLRESSPSAA